VQFLYIIPIRHFLPSWIHPRYHMNIMKARFLSPERSFESLSRG